MGVAVEIAALTAFLAPYLSRLLKPVQEAAGDALESLGEKAWQHAQALWGRLQGKVREKPAAVEVAEDVARAPEDKDAQAALTYQLKKLLSEDPSLANELSRMWDDAQKDLNISTQVNVSGERAVGVGRDNTGTISTGDSIVPERRPSPSPSPSPRAQPRPES